MEDWQLKNQKKQSRHIVSTQHTHFQRWPTIYCKRKCIWNKCSSTKLNIFMRRREVAVACDNGNVIIIIKFWHIEHKVWKRMTDVSNTLFNYYVFFCMKTLCFNTALSEKMENVTLFLHNELFLPRPSHCYTMVQEYC